MKYYSSPIRVTKHFVARQRNRGLRAELRDFIYWYGTEFDGANAVHITLLARDLPPEVRNSPVVEEARDWILVLTRSGTLLTCYHCPNATRFLRRKSTARYSTPRAA